jgi:hypothetical protein
MYTAKPGMLIGFHGCDKTITKLTLEICPVYKGPVHYLLQLYVRTNETHIE